MDREVIDMCERFSTYLTKENLGDKCIYEPLENGIIRCSFMGEVCECTTKSVQTDIDNLFVWRVSNMTDYELICEYAFVKAKGDVNCELYNQTVKRGSIEYKEEYKSAMVNIIKAYYKTTLEKLDMMIKWQRYYEIQAHKIM